MDTIIKEWRELLRAFKASVDRDVNEIRKCKAAVQNIRPDYAIHQAAGRFIRSEDPIIISSPNIIIGNVDSDGNLLGGTPGKILLRGTNLNLEGVGMPGETGSVVTKATSIRQIAVDPGIDGLEAVVMPKSEIVSQARRISIDGCSDNDVFINNPSAMSDGVTIKSDTGITIDSSAQLKGRTARLDEVSAALDELIDQTQKNVNDIDLLIDGIFRDMDKALSDADTLKYKDQEISSKVGLLDDLRKECESATIAMNDTIRKLVTEISRLAEAKRQKTAVEAMKAALPEEEDYKKNGSHSFVHVNSDLVNISSRNGDGDECLSQEAGVVIDSRRVMINGQGPDGALMEGSNFSVYTGKVEFNASTTSYGDDARTKGEIKSVGVFNVFAKNVNIKSVDASFDTGAQNEADKYKETALTKDGKLSVRIEAVDFSTVSTDGVAAGSVQFNSKKVGIVSMDLDKDSGDTKQLNAEGQVVIAAKSIFEGYQDDNFKTEKVQVLSKELVVDSINTVSVKQGGDSSIVVKEGAVSVASKKNTLTGEAEITGKAKFDDAVEAPDGKIGNLEVTGEFKSKSLSDGFKAPAAGGAKKAVEAVAAVNPEEIKPASSEAMASVLASDGNENYVVISKEEE